MPSKEDLTIDSPGKRLGVAVFVVVSIGSLGFGVWLLLYNITNRKPVGIGASLVFIVCACIGGFVTIKLLLVRHRIRSGYYESEVEAQPGQVDLLTQIREDGRRT